MQDILLLIMAVLYGVVVGSLTEKAVQAFCNTNEGTSSASHNMPKCAACGKLLGIFVDGKPYHYACADKMGPLTSA